jgi:hypothetical protein
VWFVGELKTPFAQLNYASGLLSIKLCSYHYRRILSAFEKSVSQQDKFLAKILLGTSDANIPFAQLCQLLCSLGFDKRIRGSHHIFTKEGVEEILNPQPKGSQAKAYQVKQVRAVIFKYNLGGQNDASL